MNVAANGTSTERGNERSPDRIRQDIAVKRQELAKTVERLGERIEETLDWRYQVGRHPLLAMIMAAGVGFVVFNKVGRLRHATANPLLNGAGDVAERVVAGGPTAVKGALFENLSLGPSLGAALGTAALRVGTTLLAKKIKAAVAARHTPRNGDAPFSRSRPVRGGAWGVSR
jgi:hypothetical protein